MTWLVENLPKIAKAITAAVTAGSAAAATGGTALAVVAAAVVAGLSTFAVPNKTA